MKKSIYAIIFVMTVILLVSCSNSNKEKSYNEAYCKEVSSQIIDMISPQIANARLFINKYEELDSLLNNKGDLSKIMKLDEELDYLSKQELYFNHERYESLKLELLKENYDIEGDRLLNNYIKDYEALRNEVSYSRMF